MQLGDGEVQVWSIAATADRAASLLHLLNADELARADRFLVEHARANFIAARGMLRTLAADYLGVEPQSLEFQYGAHGKPFLPSSRLRFNASHSGQFVALGFAWDLELGVDVEHMRKISDFWGVAERFFAAEEVTDLRSAPDLQAAFYRCWTRKEAYIKAAGGGLSIPLDSFRVSLLDGEPPAILSFRDQPVTAATEWSMHSWIPAPNYVAALTFRGSKRVVYRDAV